MRKLSMALFAIVALSMFVVACAAEDTQIVEVVKEVVVEKVVIKEIRVPGETIIVEKEVIRKVPGETIIVEKEVIKEVIVEVVVKKEVIREIPVETIVIVEKEVIKQVAVEKIVTVDRIVEVEVMVKPLPRPFKFSEAPMLANLVKTGTIPPVEQRLPVNPLVQPVFEEIGQYGGNWRRTFRGTADGANIMRMLHSGLLNFSEDGSHVIPYIAESWTVSADLREYTFRLRTNHKWSDGAPFNVDDIMFWYNDILLNTDLTPNMPSYYAPGGNPMVVQKIDDLTVRFSFQKPYGVFLEWFAQRDVGTAAPHQPAHYLKQFHASYADAATLDKLVADSVFDTWTGLFNDKINKTLNADIPVLDNWLSKTTLRDNQYILERNPYYFAVDTAGNQLPYIDKIVMDLIEDTEVMNLKAMAGELDFQCRFMTFKNYPLFKQNEDKSDYRTLLTYRDGSLSASVTFNQSYKDDAQIATLLQNKTFRQALSIAIDRDRINELSFLGLGTINQQTLPKDNPYYPGDEHALKYTQYDPDLAIQMLDKILPNKDSDGNRTLPDGETLILLLESWNAGPDTWAPLLQEDWAAVGVKTNWTTVQRGLFYARIRANEFQIEVSAMGGWKFLFTYPYWTAPWHNVARLGPAFGDWYQSGRETGTGIVPSGNLLRLLDILDEAQGANAERRVELAQENFRILNEELYTIGVIGKTPAPCIVKNNFRNVPNVLINEWTQRFPGNHRPETFFIKQ